VKNKKLIFENGAVFEGKGFGADIETIQEVVFNTSMVGYQEIFSDPSYLGQMVCMTYPLIGNYGLTLEDYETDHPFIGGFIVHEYNDQPSNFRHVKTLESDMKKFNIPGILGVDTREITRMIRNEGSIRALLTNHETSREQGLKQIALTDEIHNHVMQASCLKQWKSCVPGAKYHVVVLDCGVKYNIIRTLKRRKCTVTVLPSNTTSKDILKLLPDGMVISNGPGNPQDNPEIINVIQQLQGHLPIFGICLGHQLIALANGARTFKMRFGHRGSNHPVKEISTNQIKITSQNHSYAVDISTLKRTKLQLTHINLLDNTAEGLAIDTEDLFSVQYHPESSPGPNDNFYLFDKFIEKMEKRKQSRRNY
jgi:carbamoyl-phosphate synthase small subunit